MSLSPLPPKAPSDPFRLVFWSILLIVPLAALWMARKPAAAVIPVLRKDVPAYSVVNANDITIKKALASDIGPDIIRDEISLIAHYTREAIQRGQPVRKDQIAGVVEPGLIVNTVAATIPATRVTVLSDSLRAGDIVNVSTAPGPTENSQLILAGVLILDINSSPQGQTMILAIPQNGWTDYLNKTRGATHLLVAKRLR